MIPILIICGILFTASFGGSLHASEVMNPDTHANPSQERLTLEVVLDRVEQTHPLLERATAEQAIARGKLLRALGTFEPQLVNDLELERFVSDNTTKTAGFNDTFLELRHPWGPKVIGGFRTGLGPVKVADLGVGDGNQPLLGLVLPLLRGFMVNPERAQLQRSELAAEQAQVEIDQTRQDLFLGAAHQYWAWVAAVRILETRQEALDLARERLAQIGKQADTGAVPAMEHVEARLEAQRRQETLVAATRRMEQEAYKLSLFLWEDDTPTLPSASQAHEFPAVIQPPSRMIVQSDKQKALEVRPEIRAVALDAQRNEIDLDLAENTRLPYLNAVAQPSRKVGDFVLGLGHQLGMEMRFPFLQRSARGDVLQAKSKRKQLVLAQKYRQQQVSVDVDNALSAIERARERAQIAADALSLANRLVEGERRRFRLGATTVLFVNLRERNAVDTRIQLIQAQAEYHRAIASYRWAIGDWLTGSRLPSQRDD